MDMNEESYPVILRIYDLSNGQAKVLSKKLLGFEIEAVFHTSVEVYNKEYWFGQDIYNTHPGTSGHGNPNKIVLMGHTDIPHDCFLGYLEDLREKYENGTYDLFKNNCNHFSNDIMQFLVGKTIPKEILDLPELVLKSPMFGIIMNFMKGFQQEKQ